jgi:hypothetical protein
MAVTDKNLISRHFVTFLRASKLVSNPFHILEQNLLYAAIVKFRGPAVGVASDPPSGFQGAVIFQEIRDASRPE